MGRGQTLGPTVNDFKMLGPLRINVDVSECITQTMEAGGIGQEDDILRWVEMPDDEVAGKNAF